MVSIDDNKCSLCMPSIGTGRVSKENYDKFATVCSCCHWLVMNHLVARNCCVFASQPVMVGVVAKQHIVYPNNSDKE